MDNALHIKVCGMTNKLNIHELLLLPIQYMGLIFYAKSARYVDKNYQDLALENTPNHIRLTGVFVNEKLEKVIKTIHQYHLKAVQLHGNESIEYCISLKNNFPQLHIFKAFGIAEGFNFTALIGYAAHVDFFLLDTQTVAHGGSGTKFDWGILNKYKLNTLFFLSGGIGPDDVEDIQKLKHPQLVGLDINSKFEIAPGLKNIALVKQFITALKQNTK